jgi:hypothetical protein
VAAGTWVAGGGSITAGPDWVTLCVGELLAEADGMTVPATAARATTGLGVAGDPPTVVTATTRARPNTGHARHAARTGFFIWLSAPL